MSQPYTVCLIGTGRIGVMHAAILRNRPLVGRLLLADAHPSRAEAAARQLGCETATADETLNPGNPLGVDALVIATATATHAELLIRAAATGVPTYCEKPLALDLQSPAT